MRNTLQYPITKQEIIRTLEKLELESRFDSACGDIDPLIIREAINIVKSSDYNEVEEMPYPPRPYYTPFEPIDKPKCHICGLVFDGPMGYVCIVDGCPSRVTC